MRHYNRNVVLSWNLSVGILWFKGSLHVFEKCTFSHDYKSLNFDLSLLHLCYPIVSSKLTNLADPPDNSIIASSKYYPCHNVF